MNLAFRVTWLLGILLLTGEGSKGQLYKKKVSVSNIFSLRFITDNLKTNYANVSVLSFKEKLSAVCPGRLPFVHATVDDVRHRFLVCASPDPGALSGPCNVLLRRSLKSPGVRHKHDRSTGVTSSLFHSRIPINQTQKGMEINYRIKPCEAKSNLAY